MTTYSFTVASRSSPPFITDLLQCRYEAAQTCVVYMTLSKVLWRVFYVLVVPAVLSVLLLYNYPLVFQCSFPEARSVPAVDAHNTSRAAVSASQLAPFRLLALGDPQLEGDSSLPNPGDPLFPSVQRLRRRDYSDFSRGFPTVKPTLPSCLKDFWNDDLPRALWTYRKRLDLFGNDYYLAHVYRTLEWYLKPTHVAVLGDLIGSQWVADEEFERRSWRYWNRVFSRGKRVEDQLMNGVRVNATGRDKSWRRRIINIAGNHDIGYAGDITRNRVSRFETTYGKVNWDVTFDYPSTSSTSGNSSLRLVMLNDMNLDGPAYDHNIQAETYSFINEQVIGKGSDVDDPTAATLLLTHIPLAKQEGVCVDGPLFEYSQTGIREQNQLSPRSSQHVLTAIFGMYHDPALPNGGWGRPGIILNGHDHEGCDVYHHHPANSDTIPAKEQGWSATRWSEVSGAYQMPAGPGIREITVRSMMGSYGGNAGLLSAWFDEGAQRWSFAYDTCALGVQHFWWAIHVLALVTWCVFGAALLASTVEASILSKSSGPGLQSTSGTGSKAQKRSQANGASDRSTVRAALAADLSDEKVYGGDTTGLATGYDALQGLRVRSRRL